MKPLHVPPGRLQTHQLPRQAFDELCSGAVTEKFIAAVDASQYSRRKLLLRALTDFCARHPATVGPLTDVESLWEILATAEERDPATVREMLTHPTVGVWATRTLRKVHGHEPDSIPVWSEFGYLHSLIAAAAMRTRVPCEIRLPVIRGVVTLPTVGQVQLPTSFPAGFADLHNTGSTTVLGTTRDKNLVTLTTEAVGPHFFPARRHVITSRGLRLAVEINDSDPYRELSTPIPPRRLDPVRFAEWGKMLDEAFDILTLWHPEYARELAAGLRMVTPLVSDGSTRGASSSVAIGCVAAAEKNSATALAETLVHEFQHSKLNGLFSLFDVGHEENLYAPWRDDPRPLSGLLHGIFAFFSVADFWSIQRDLVSRQETRAAHFTFALRRHQVSEAVRSLRDHPALTRIGRELVDAVHTRLAPLEQQPVSPDLTETVAKITDDHRAIWRSRYARPDSGDVARLTSEWLAGLPASRIAASRIVPNPRYGARPARRHLLQLKATEPETFAEVMRRSTASPADAAYLSGDHIAATAGYLTWLRNAPDDADNWVGLGLALRARGNPAAAGILTTPETTLAVSNRILELTGTAPDPLHLADWIRARTAGIE